MKISLLQYDAAYLQIDSNLESVSSLVGDLKTDLLVLPELFATGYFFESEEDAASVAEPTDGKTFEFCRSLAKRVGGTIVYGYSEQDGSKRYNSAAVVGVDGLVSNYRKTHLYYKEKVYFEPGNTGFSALQLTTTAGDTYSLGVMICFDWYFPESARTLALLGADIIAHPSNLVRKNCPRSMPIRALENRVFTATANRIGAEGEVAYIGQSLVCDPRGEVLVSAGRETQEVVSCEIDLAMARQKQLTTTNHMFGDRRPELYGLGGTQG